MTTYDTTRYISPTPRCAGWYTVSARIVWTPRGGTPVVIDGQFLDAHNPNGAVIMGCGIEELVQALDLWDVVGDHVIVICDLVTAQLAERPWAVLVCPQGKARLELIPR